MTLKALKYGFNFGLSFAVMFYTAFVLTMLWNWFGTSAFHVNEISYWNMFGLVLILRVLTPNSAAITVEKWERAMKMLEACIPEGTRVEVMQAIEKDSWGLNAQLLIANGTAIFGNTMTLVIGWAVHTVLM